MFCIFNYEQTELQNDQYTTQHTLDYRVHLGQRTLSPILFDHSQYLFLKSFTMLIALLNFLTVSLSPLTALPNRTHSNSFSVHFRYIQCHQYLYSFFPFTSKIQNSMPNAVFSPSYNLNTFKRVLHFKIKLTTILHI